MLVITLGLAILFIFTSLYCYRERVDRIYELTFLSNFFAGLFLLGTAAALIFERKVPNILYLDVTMLLALVLFVCTAFHDVFDFKGMFLFLHMLNPSFMAIYYFIFCDMNESAESSSVLSIFFMPGAYLVFAAVFGKVTGNYIYFFLNAESHGYMYCMMFVFLLTVIFLMLGYALFYVNRILFRIRKNKPHHV